MHNIVLVLVVATLTLLLASASRRGVREDGRMVLVYSPVWKGLVRILWAFPAVIAAVSIFSPPDPGERWIPFAIIFGFAALALPLTLEVMRRRIELTDSGISRISPWSAPLTIAWRDVRTVKWLGLSSEIELRSARAKVKVSLWLSGMESFAEALDEQLAHLPAVPEVTRKLRAFRV